jgi:hypothetical protein
LHGSQWRNGWLPSRSMITIGNGTAPILDMWEHAYYLQYETVKGDWVKAFWKIVNWEDVGQRLKKVRALDLGVWGAKHHCAR